jgi:hypothetical protein
MIHTLSHPIFPLIYVTCVIRSINTRNTDALKEWEYIVSTEKNLKYEPCLGGRK